MNTMSEIMNAAMRVLGLPFTPSLEKAGLWFYELERNGKKCNLCLRSSTSANQIRVDCLGDSVYSEGDVDRIQEFIDSANCNILVGRLHFFCQCRRLGYSESFRIDPFQFNEWFLASILVGVLGQMDFYEREIMSVLQSDSDIHEELLRVLSTSNVLSVCSLN